MLIHDADRWFDLIAGFDCYYVETKSRKMAVIAQMETGDMDALAFAARLDIIAKWYRDIAAGLTPSLPSRSYPARCQSYARDNRAWGSGASD